MCASVNFVFIGWNISCWTIQRMGFLIYMNCVSVCGCACVDIQEASAAELQPGLLPAGERPQHGVREHGHLGGV